MLKHKNYISYAIFPMLYFLSSKKLYRAECTVLEDELIASLSALVQNKSYAIDRS